MSEPPVPFTSGPFLALYLISVRFTSFLFMCLLSSSVAVMKLASKVAEYALWSRMTYLTSVWELDTTRAAAIVNGCNGIETIMPTGMTFLVDAFVGDYHMLLFSSFAYSLGMGFLALSTPLVPLKDAAGKCGSENFSADHCDIQHILFYISLFFIVIGVSGHAASFSSFLKQPKPIQTESDQDDLERKKPGKSACFWKFTRLSVQILLGFVLSYMPWYAQFGIPAILILVGLVAIILFVRGSGSDKYAKPRGSPLTSVFRVFVASAFKMRCPLPQDVDRLHENRTSSLRVPHTQGLRYLDKAAIVVSTQTLEQQEQNRWKLCCVSEVEETKIFIRMIPIWMIYIMCGLVSSVGDTYFLDQAYNLNEKVGRVKAPTLILRVFQDIVQFMFGEVTKKLTKRGLRKYAAPIGMIIAMLFSVLCCITAARVETMRLDEIKSTKNNETIQMSMFWLLPQFFFLGAIDGISHNLFGVHDQISSFNIACFFDRKVPDSIIPYLQIFNDSVFGIGILGSVVSVYIVGKVKPSWFQDKPDESHLDNYYWTLAVLSSLTLNFSILVAIWYRYQHSRIEVKRKAYIQLSTLGNADVMKAEDVTFEHKAEDVTFEHGIESQNSRYLN